MGYKARFSPRFFRSKCKLSPLPCFPWDSVGGVGQGGSAYSTKAELNPLALGALQGCSSGLGCWDGWRHGWSAWAVASSGAGAGRRCNAVIFCALPLLLPSPLSPSPDRRLPGCRWWAGSGTGLGAVSLGAGVPGYLGWWDAGASCWPCVLSASAGCWTFLVYSGVGSPLVPAGLCWALTAWVLLGAGSGSAWASLVPGSPPGCRAGRVSRPCRWWWLGWVIGWR